MHSIELEGIVGHFICLKKKKTLTFECSWPLDFLFWFKNVEKK